MRLPDWSEEQVEECQVLWEECKGSSGSQIFSSVAELLSHEAKKQVTPQQLRLVQSSEMRNEHYDETSLRKKRGGRREIAIPKQPIMWLQRRFLQVCTHLFPRHKCAHGFEREKGIVTHASQHTQKSWVYCLDIQNFFPSINWGRVRGLFQAYPFEASHEVAQVLANLVTYKGALPQGAPTSPILSNLLCRKLDSRLFKWARQNGYSYSRYADDLTFSTNRDSFPEGDRAFIKEIIEEEGFEVHSGKERLMPDHARQMVTGLVVNEKVNVPREYVRGLRALLHNVERHGWRSQVERQEWLFDDVEEWKSYRSRELTAEEYEALQEKQRQERALVNPNALMPEIRAMVDQAQSSDSEEEVRNTYREAISRFKKKVRGRIEYVGCVKGKDGDDGKTYRHLRDWYDFLREFDDQVGARYSDLKQEVLETDAEYAKRQGRYRSLLNRIRGVEKSELIEELERMSDQTIEFEWIRKDQDEDDLRREVRGIAYRAITHPRVTGRFLSHFNRKDGCFRGLLHSPDVAGEEDVEDLIQEAATLFAIYSKLLPNALKGSVDNFLQRCKKKLRQSGASWHPWEDKEFLDSHLLPFKRQTRFDDDDEATDLLYHLDEKADEVEKVGVENGESITVDLPIAAERIFTHTDTVKKGVALLLESMMTNSNDESPRIEIDIRSGNTGDNETDLNSVIFEVFEDDATIRKDPKLESLFGGKLQAALRHLRGYADWRLSAPFSNGCSYRFNVMMNERSEPLPEPLSGIRHRLIFYQ